MMKGKIILLMIILAMNYGCKSKEKNVKIPIAIKLLDSLQVAAVNGDLEESQNIKTMIYFKFDEWEVENEYKNILDTFISFAEGKKGTIIITGHTDSIGGNRYNENLSLRRAMSVYEYLKEDLGDKNYSYEVSGRGKQELVYTGSDIKKNIHNRRVKIAFVIES